MRTDTTQPNASSGGSDRELLELAARAAGYEVIGWDDRIPGTPIVKGDRLGSGGMSKWYWIPLADDGDALRLAVKLGIESGWYALAGYACARAVPATGHVIRVEEYGSSDPYAATRRAIVRAAAAMAGGEPT